MNEINFEIQDIEKIDLSMDAGIKKIYPPIENLEVMPTKEQQIFTHENSYGYDNVTINPIPDEYIIPDGTLPITENATYDVRKFARVSASVYPAPNLQDKEITIEENGTHNITADEEYDGLNQVSVTVNAIEDLSEELGTYNQELIEQETTITNIIETLQNKALKEIKLQDKEINITTNGTQNIVADNGYDGLGNVDITVNVESGGSGNIQVLHPLTPLVYSSDYNGVTSVTTNAVEILNKRQSVTETGDVSSIIMPGIVCAFVRSDFTLSDNLTLIDENDWTVDPNDSSCTQKILICWCDNVNQNFTISQASSGRMGIGFVSFIGGVKPTIEIFKKESGYSVRENKTLPIKSGLTIYFVTGIYTTTLSALYTNNKDEQKYISIQNSTHLIGRDKSSRLGIYAYYSNTDTDTILNGTGNDTIDIGLIGITVK